MGDQKRIQGDMMALTSFMLRLQFDETLYPKELRELLKELREYIVFISRVRRKWIANPNTLIVLRSKREVAYIYIMPLDKKLTIEYPYYRQDVKLDETKIIEGFETIRDVIVWCYDDVKVCKEEYIDTWIQLQGDIAIVIDTEDGKYEYPILKRLLKYVSIGRELLRPM
mgnify:FL=1